MTIGTYLFPKLPTFSMRKKIEFEQLAKRVVTFYNNEGGRVMKRTAAHFKKEKVPERTIDNIISKYLTYNSTEFRPKSGRPLKIFDQKLRSLGPQVYIRRSATPSQNELPEALQASVAHLQCHFAR